MKFWQLVSIAGGPAAVARIAERCSEWKGYGESATNFSVLVDRQDRRVLDALVDQAFSEAVLAEIETPLFLGEGWLRSSRRGSERKVFVLEAARRFGGEAVEDALEKGSVAI